MQLLAAGPAGGKAPPPSSVKETRGAGRHRPADLPLLPWSLSVEAGSSIVYMNPQVARWSLAISLSRLLGRHLDLELTVRSQEAELASHLDASARVGLHLRWGRWSVVPGFRLG